MSDNTEVQKEQVNKAYSYCFRKVPCIGQHNDITMNFIARLKHPALPRFMDNIEARKALKPKSIWAKFQSKYKPLLTSMHSALSNAIQQEKVKPFLAKKGYVLDFPRSNEECLKLEQVIYSPEDDIMKVLEPEKYNETQAPCLS